VYLILIGCGSSTQVLPSIVHKNLSGKYTGQNGGVVLDVWIAWDTLENSTPSNVTRSDIAPVVLVSDQKDTAKALNYMQNNLNTETYTRAVCQKAIEQLRSNRNGNRESLAPVLWIEAMRRLWRSHTGSLSALASISIPQSWLPDEDLELLSQGYDFIYFNTNDEYRIQFVQINMAGNVENIKLLETGYIKKPWNYVLGGPRIKLTKSLTTQSERESSSEEKDLDLLWKFYLSNAEVYEKFRQYQDDRNPENDIKKLEEYCLSIKGT